MSDPMAVPSAVAAPATPSLVSAYQNPYTSDVLDSALKQLKLQGAQAKNQLGTEAFQSGAYGDARHGVESGMLDKNLASAAGDLTASVNSDAYNQAMGWLNTDLDRQSNTAFQNAQLDQDWMNNQFSGINLDNILQQAGITNAQSLADADLGLDQYDRGITQDQLNTQFDDWTTQQNWDADKLNQFLGFISGVPGQTGSTSTTTSPNNSWASLLGAALSGAKNSDGTKLFG